MGHPREADITYVNPRKKIPVLTASSGRFSVIIGTLGDRVPTGLSGVPVNRHDPCEEGMPLPL